MNNNEIKPLSIKEFLSNDKYVIPIYQRNYDWGEKEALQLIEDIADYAKEHPDVNYYIGSMVVFPKKKNGETLFETIDGQQRLTTLTILSRYLLKDDSNTHINLAYDHRKEAEETLANLKSENIEYSVHPSAQNIVDVYKIFKKNVPEILRGKGLSEEQFSGYLYNNVIIVRIPVPEDTELNHYFEIMNTRGEQLEKHEVLKATLMSHLKEKKELHLFHMIWEACSDMFSYVQMNFPSNYRNIIFSEQWDELKENNFDKIVETITNKNVEGSPNEPVSIKELIENAHKKRYELPTEGVANGEERFEAIINFPNFLLQSLKILCHKKYGNELNVDDIIKLDDKRLIPIFEKVIDSFEGDISKKDFVKDFIVQLMILRMKFDRYVIKREYVNGHENWSLKRLKKDSSNKGYYINSFSKEDGEDEDDYGKDIRMLEAMFHVSAPTQIYKHWLNAVLYVVYNEPNIDAQQLKNRLYLLATTYMSDIYLADEKTTFEDIIYKNNFVAKKSSLNFELINNGCNVPNFVFNFYDYITWKEDVVKYPKFEFTYRTSVEHFYPQSPMQGYDKLERTILDNFGNLCLISRSMNSKFSNNMPKAKLENFGLSDDVKNGLSLKLLEMMDIVRDSDWDENQIIKFGKKAVEKLHKAIENKGENVMTSIF